MSPPPSDAPSPDEDLAAAYKALAAVITIRSTVMLFIVTKELAELTGASPPEPVEGFSVNEIGSMAYLARRATAEGRPDAARVWQAAVNLALAPALSTVAQAAASVTPPPSKPKHFHSHRCEKDGTIWEHETPAVDAVWDAAFRAAYAARHLCPKCGQNQRFVYSQRFVSDPLQPWKRSPSFAPKAPTPHAYLSNPSPPADPLSPTAAQLLRERLQRFTFKDTDRATRDELLSRLLEPPSTRFYNAGPTEHIGAYIREEPDRWIPFGDLQQASKKADR